MAWVSMYPGWDAAVEADVLRWTKQLIFGYGYWLVAQHPLTPAISEQVG